MIEPSIQGVIARNSHPAGCAAFLRSWAARCKAPASNLTLSAGPRVLVLGASSGYGLALRTVLLQEYAARTLGVAYERGPSGQYSGSAGWHLSAAFAELAAEQGLPGETLMLDAFAPASRQTVIETIRRDFGQVDLVVYSLAAGQRTVDGRKVRSAIKPAGAPYQGYQLDLATDQLQPVTLEPASSQEMADTVTVMGGEDWQQWMTALQEADVLAPGARSVAFSYIGPASTWPLYRDGTLGQAKADLHQRAQQINAQLQTLGGGAWVVVAKALVTKASIFIPGMAPYLMALYAVMKEQGVHEDCLDQMQRLCHSQLFAEQVHTDSDQLIRLDDWELAEPVQQAVDARLALLNPDNFMQYGDYQGVKQEFLAMNGFGIAGVDYSDEGA